MSLMVNFLLAFAFSFVGSIPPGILNLTVIQLGLEHKIKMAYRFAFASAIIEYPYAWIAVAFEEFLSSYTRTETYLQLTAASVLLVVGILSLVSTTPKWRDKKTPLSNSGFRRGIILSIINPMALPFWLATTAYLKSLGVVKFSGEMEIHAYLFGVVFGAFTLLITAAHLAKYASRFFAPDSVFKKVPGAIMTAIGIYGLIEYIL